MATKLWPFRPDWENGILERLEWLTDMMASTKGAEQRRPQRLTPRRTLEATFLPHGRQRAVFDLQVMVKGNDDWFLPLWFDVDVLQEPISATETALRTPYEDREFTKDGYAVIRPVTSSDHEYHTFTHEIVKIVGTKQDRLIVVRGQEGTTAREWPEGSEVYPLRQGRFVDQPSVNVVTAAIGSTNMKFMITEPNEWFGLKRFSGYGAAYGSSYGTRRDISPRTPAKNLGKVADPSYMPVFEGFKVMNAEPDYNQDMTMVYDRLINTLDNQNGIPEYQDALGFATPSQQHTWFLKGRAEQAAFRTMLYFLRGRVKPVWVPTFNADVQLIAPVPAGQNYIDIINIGYVATGSKSINRQCLAIQKNTGEWIFQRINACAVVGDYERLELSNHFLEDLRPDDIYKISFMCVSRLDQDGVEINHVTDNQGLAKSVTTFRCTPDLRKAEPWAVTWPPSWRACDRSCASMPRVETNVGFGLPNEDWSIADTITTALYSELYSGLGYSHKYDPADVIEPWEQSAYFQWFLGGTPYVYDEQSIRNSFAFRYFNWTGYNRSQQIAFLETVLPDKFMDEIREFDDAKLYDFYIRQQLYWDYQTRMEEPWQMQAIHLRNWLPLKKLTEIQQTCSNNMLGRFCVQSVYTRSPVDRYPTNARGSHTLYGSGVLYHLRGRNEADFPTDLSELGQSYTHSLMPFNGNGLHSSCGCLCLQFIEDHSGLRTRNENPSIDPDKVLWWHRAQISWLTTKPWPNNIRLVMYDSLTGQLMRTLDLEVENIPVSGYADEYTKTPWPFQNLPEPQVYTGNLVVFRKSYGRENAMTAFHPDPWDNIWNIVPLNSKGFVVEVYPR